MWKKPKPANDNRPDPTPEQEEQTYRNRQNLAAVIALVALLAIAFWLFHVMSGLNRNLDCLQSGRTNCSPIEQHS